MACDGAGSTGDVYQGRSLMRSWTSVIVLAAFILNVFLPPSFAQVSLPQPGSMVALSPSFHPPVLTGVKVFAKDPFRFDFILDPGDSAHSDANQLVKYFLAALTVPDKDMWVNLSPYEKDRIVPDAFGQTEMGRDLLAQDYLLKQITSSLMYPEGDVGKLFWQKIYAMAAQKFGNTDIPVDTFNKVWIVPSKAVVYENTQTHAAYVVASSLKVMLASDYEAMSHHSQVQHGEDPQRYDDVKRIIREVIIPVLEKEVNEGKNFMQLRQVYNSLILATWYKKKIKDSLLSRVYVGREKVAGLYINDPQETQKIWGRYVEAFRKGAFDYVREEYDPLTRETIPRKYFSGGVELIKPDLVFVSGINASQLPLRSQQMISTRIDAAERTDKGSTLELFSRSGTMSLQELYSPRLRYSLRQQILKGIKVQWVQDLQRIPFSFSSFNEMRLRGLESDGVFFVDPYQSLKEYVQETTLNRSIMFVFEEILKNACDAYAIIGAEGPVLFRIKETSNEYFFEILDNGIGYPVDQRKSLPVAMMYSEFLPGESTGLVSVQALIDAICQLMGMQATRFADVPQAIEWLNQSILPYQIFNKFKSEDGAYKNQISMIESISKLVLERWGIAGSKMPEDEKSLKKMVTTPEGQALKRLILKVFLPQFNLKERFNKEGESGLGVAWTKVLAQAYGGSFEFFRPEDTGYVTGFRIALPKAAVSLEIQGDGDVPIASQNMADVIFSGNNLPVSPREEADFSQNQENAKNGGIDLTSERMSLETQGGGAGFVLDVDPAQISRYQTAPGFLPVIIGVEAGVDIPGFLGLVSTTIPGR